MKLRIFPSRWQRRFPIRPWCERLEERTAPAIFLIGPGDVYGPNGLVATLAIANSNGQSNTLVLAARSTYTVNKVDNFWYGPDGLPPISSDLTIEGNGANLQRDVNLGTATPFRLFFISGGLSNPALLPAGHLTLHNLTLQGGLALGGKGGDGNFGGGGAAGLGGVIFNQGTLDLDSVTLTGNTALGGAGGSLLVQGGIGGGGGLGGAGGDGFIVDSGGGGGGFSSAGLADIAGSTGGRGLEGTEGGVTGAAGGTGGFSSFGGNGAAAGQNAAGGGGGFVQGQDAVGATGSGFGGLGSSGDGGQGGTNANAAAEAGGGGAFGGGGGGGDNSGAGGGGVGGGGGGGTEGGGGGFGGGGGGFGLGGFGGGGGALDQGGFGGGRGGLDALTAGGGGGAGMGGAVFTMFGSLHAVNSTFAGNIAQGGKGGSGAGPFAIGVGGGSGLGGALFNLNGSVTLTNCTLAANTVVAGSADNPGQADGDAIFNLAFGNQVKDGSAVTAALTLTNTILTGSSGTQHDLVNAEVDGKQTNNAVVDATTPNLVTASSSSGNATIMGLPLTGNPQLGPLQDNGGPTATMELLAGSPALNAGTLNGAPATDQRGVPRGSTINLGAFQATANHFVVNGFPPVITAGQGGTFTVTALDPFGQTAFGYTGTATFSATGASTLPAPAPLTNGIGTFPATLFTAGTQSLAASDGTLSGSQTGILVLPAAAAQITLAGGSGQSTPVQTPFPLPLQALVTDAFNNPITGANVAFAAPAAGASGIFAANATVATVNGLATAPALTANTLAGSFVVTATLAGVGSVSFNLTNTPGKATSIAVFAGTPQSATVGTAYAVPLQAQVMDAFGNVVPGAGVTFATPAAGASGTFASNATVTTDAAGVATAPTLVANGTAGNFTATATLAGAGSVNFDLTNLSGSPALVVTVFGTPQSTVVTKTFATALQVRVTDALTNPLPGISVTFAAPVSGASGTFAGPTTLTTNAAGVATAPALTANTIAGNFAVTAAVNGALSVNFNLTNLPGSAVQIVTLTGSGQSTTVNTPFATLLQALVTDAFGNAITGANVTFQAPATGPSGTFVANPTVATVNGVATAPALTANTIAGNFTVTASTAGAGSVTFALGSKAGSVASIVVANGNGQSVPTGAPFPRQLQVLVSDGFGNPECGAPVTFTAPGGGAGGAFNGGSGTVITDATGIAYAPVLVANGTPGSFTVMASSGGFATSFGLTNVAPPLAFSSAALRPRLVRRSAMLKVSVDGAAGLPTGNVQLFDVCEGRQRLLCTLRLANGKALRKVKLRPGTHRLSVVFGGNEVYQGSSAKVVVNVR